jgi:hypothetical protein
MASATNKARARRTPKGRPKLDPEFEAEATLQRLAELLKDSPGGKKTPHAVAITHMTAHGSTVPSDGVPQCKRHPCKVLGVAYAYSEIRDWLDWTTNGSPDVELELGAHEFTRGIVRHPFLTEIKKYLRQNYRRYHPTKTRHTHLWAAEHANLCVAPAQVLSSTKDLVRSVDAFIGTLQVPPTVVDQDTGGPGRPKQALFRAVAQHLFAGGQSPERVATLLGCNPTRARNAIRSDDVRRYFSETGIRALPKPRKQRTPGANQR